MVEYEEIDAALATSLRRTLAAAIIGGLLVFLPGFANSWYSRYTEANNVKSGFIAEIALLSDDDQHNEFLQLLDQLIEAHKKNETPKSVFVEQKNTRIYFENNVNKISCLEPEDIKNILTFYNIDTAIETIALSYSRRKATDPDHERHIRNLNRVKIKAQEQHKIGKELLASLSK